MKGLIVLGSSRSDGETSAIAGLVSLKTRFDVIDLLEFDINRFDYNNKFADDDFIPLIDRLTKTEVIVFATPIYWYSMSGIMKDFIDRLSDLLKFEKDRGRLLRGKKMALISSSSSEDFPDYFLGPFEDTAAYLGMEFLGHLHSWEVEGDIGVEDTEIDAFVANLV